LPGFDAPGLPRKDLDGLHRAIRAAETLGAHGQHVGQVFPGEVGDVVKTAAGAAGDGLADLKQANAPRPGTWSYRALNRSLWRLHGSVTAFYKKWTKLKLFGE
jgi:hypothetical protein